MAGEANGAVGQAGAAPATQGGAQPSSNGGPSVPQGYTLVREDEWGQAQRWRQQVEGTKQEFDRYKGQFEPWKTVIDTFAKSGVDPKSFTGKAPESDTGKGFDPAHVDQMLEEKFGAFEKKMRTAQAMSSHEASMQAQRKALDKLVGDVVGDKADDATKNAVRAMAMGMYDENLRDSFYDKDHPLHESAFAPLPEDKWAKLSENLGTAYKSLRGAQIGAVADAAAKLGKSAPAGQSSSGATDKAKPKNLDEALEANIRATLQNKR